MGIINVTPDSFFAGSRHQHTTDILRTAEQMLTEGADILDIGGMSSRPGADIITVAEELQRVIPAIEAIKTTFPQAIISIDTIHAEVARQAVGAGAGIVNDVSAGRIDPHMYTTVAALGVPYILMHSRGTPATMQQLTDYNDVVQDVVDFFTTELLTLRNLGVKDVVIDPGFGFGKTLPQNYDLLRQLHVFQILGVPVLAGISRKSMIYKLLGTTPEASLNGTSVLHWVALEQGAKLLRVHDVKPAREVVQIFAQLRSK
jgi:dihydropteroate synthase